MTTVLAPNVHNIAVQGTFDDCQDLAKACFNDLAFRDRHALTAVNSINFARVMAQIVYYFWAALKLGAPDRPVAFTVPSGNFGNVYAGYAAKQMGLPISHFVVGANSNDILARFFESGTMTMSEVVPTLSPSMDIQISSNFERLLFDLYDRNGATLADAMTAFRSTGTLKVGENAFTGVRQLFDAGRIDDAGTIAAAYDKVHLVPFGEYLPFQERLEALGLEAVTRQRGGFSAGDRRRTLTVPGAPPVGILICYEVIFPGAVTAADLRPQWLLNVTNDAWFGFTPGPYQHMHQTAVRAVEEGLPVVRAANNGISAVVDPTGRVLRSLPLGARDVLDAELPKPLPPTVFSRAGHVPLAVAWIGLALVTLRSGARRPRHPA